MSKHNDGHSMKFVDIVYRNMPAFTDIFDEEAWYIFVTCFIALTTIVFIFLCRFVKLKPVDW